MNKQDAIDSINEFLTDARAYLEHAERCGWSVQASQMRNDIRLAEGQLAQWATKPGMFGVRSRVESCKA